MIKFVYIVSDSENPVLCVFNCNIHTDTPATFVSLQQTECHVLDPVYKAIEQIISYCPGLMRLCNNQGYIIGAACSLRTTYDSQKRPVIESATLTHRTLAIRKPAGAVHCIEEKPKLKC